LASGRIWSDGARTEDAGILYKLRSAPDVSADDPLKNVTPVGRPLAAPTGSYFLFQSITLSPHGDLYGAVNLRDSGGFIASFFVKLNKNARNDEAVVGRCTLNQVDP
jgi:hypothetical protein